MNSRQLRWILSNDKVTSRTFKGVYALDEIVHIQQKSFLSAYVFNLDLSYKPGSHWVAVYIDRKERPEYLDSFGCPPPREIKDRKLEIQSRTRSRILFYDMWTICCVLYLSKMFWFNFGIYHSKIV